MPPLRTTDPDIRLLQAVADPTRLAILRQLADEATVCACDFTSCCDVSQPTISHHLRVLRESGLVRSERRGTWVYYSLEPGAVERLAGIVRSVSPTGPPRVRGAAGRGTRLPVVDGLPAS